MSQTQGAQDPVNYNELLALLKNVFKGREDVVPRYWKSNERSGYTPICNNEWNKSLCRKPCKDCFNKDYFSLNDDLLIKHIDGNHILGVYPLLQNNTCNFVAFDFDNHKGNLDPLQDVLELYAVCEVQGIPCYVLRSKSGTGYHVYVFFAMAIPAWKARIVSFALLQEAQLIEGVHSVSSFDRMFPSQDEVTKENPLGNLIALPFQGEAAKAGHTLLLDPDTKFSEPYKDQIGVLRSVVRINEAHLDKIIADCGLARETIQASRPKAKSGAIELTISPPGEGIPEGRRNTALTSTAGSLRRQGKDYEEIKEKLIHMNATKCEPPLAESEVERIAQSISQYPVGSNSMDQAASLASAKEAITGLPERSKADPGAPFEAKTLQALMVIKKQDPAEWARLRQKLKAAEVSLRDLDNAMKQARIRTEAGISGESDGQSGPSHPYCVHDGVLNLRQRGRESDYLEPLCNFNASVIGEKVYDDGAEQTAVFVIRGERQDGQPLPTVEVPASQFGSMAWVPNYWGAPAALYAGQGVKDHTRAAIQFLSGEVPRETVYAHLGWKKINGFWVYLHQGGGVSQDGTVPGISVSLGDSRLREYSLPEPPIGEELRFAVQASLLLLQLVPASIAYPMIAGIYRSALAEIAPIDFSIFLSGQSGTRKTELTAQMQAHQGAGFHGKNLPANWYGTPNAMEKMAFLVKDGIMTIDDFCPTGTAAEVQTMHSKADRILRGAGNRSGRQRMRPDGSLRPEYYPRGLVLSSGEDIPKGHSLRGRMLVLEISPGEVNLETLTQVQQLAAEGVLAQAKSGYLQWLAARMDELAGKLPGELQTYGTEARASLAGVHARTPDIVASLAAGLFHFLAFAEESGAITAIEAQKHKEEGWQALIEAGRGQARHLGSEDVVNQFFRLLTAAINSGVAHLANPEDNREPEEAGSWGWRTYNNNCSLDPLGTRIGWIEGQNIYLIPDAAFATVQKLAHSQGTNLPFHQPTLWKRLAEKGHLISTEPGRHTVRLTVAGKRSRVIHLKKAALGGVEDEVEIPLAEASQAKDCGSESGEWRPSQELDWTAEEFFETVH